MFNLIINGDALTVLKRMDSESVHCSITSPPYYGLRKYLDDGSPQKRYEVGQEETPQQYIQNLVEIFHELKRVLRNDGIFWLNIGDSYAGSHGNGYKQSLQKTNGAYSSDMNFNLAKKMNKDETGYKPKDLIGIPWMLAFSMRADGWYLRSDIPWIKRNSMPSSVTDRPASSIEHVFLFSKSGDTQFWTHPTFPGIRLQPDPDYCWKDKREGVVLSKEPSNWKTEIRHDSNGEIIYKGGKPELRYKRFNLWDGHDYYYDHIATMQPSSESYNKDKRPRGVIRQKVNKNTKYDRNDPQYTKITTNMCSINADVLRNANVNFLPSGNNGAIIFDSPEQMEEKIKKQDLVGNETYTGFNDRYEPNGFGLRYMRDSDFFFKTWNGLLHNEDGEPMALIVNPKPYKGAHFAAFPVKLVEPLILAGTSEKGVCPHCGAPWVRVTKKGEFKNQSWGGEHVKGQSAVGGVGETSCLKTGGVCEIITINWQPSCSCANNIPIPATVLDPFSGSSATGVACKLHNRDYIGIELNPEYCELGEKRIVGGK